MRLESEDTLMVLCMHVFDRLLSAATNTHILTEKSSIYSRIGRIACIGKADGVLRSPSDLLKSNGAQVQAYRDQTVVLVLGAKTEKALDFSFVREASSYATRATEKRSKQYCGPLVETPLAPWRGSACAQEDANCGDHQPCEQRSAVYCSCSEARRASEEVRSMCLASLASEIGEEDMRRHDNSMTR